MDDGDHRRGNRFAGPWLFHFLAKNKGQTRYVCHIYGLVKFLTASVTYGEPTPSNGSMHDVKNNLSGHGGGEGEEGA